MLNLAKSGKFRDSNELTPRPRTYSLLPFRFERLGDKAAVVITDPGEYAVIPYEHVSPFISGELDPSTKSYSDLRSIGALIDQHSTYNTRLQILKLRSKYRELPWFTGLHMMVVTLRCNQSCPYCQVSRQSEDRAAFDMSQENADKALQHIFRSPNPALKIEFQGGESLLNFELIKYIVKQAKEINKSEGRNLAFVAATNMTHVSDEVIDFFEEHGVLFSTSIDGPNDLHNTNRPYKGKDAFEIVCSNIKKVQARLGHSAVSALMTTTARSLDRYREIIDQYIELGFDGIFLRSLSPYGFAIKTKTYYEYSSSQWIEFYKNSLEHILDINRNGHEFTEYYTALVLTKMFKLKNTGFVDLQSPAGIGTMGVIYDFNGKVYGSDEGRMMSQMGDEMFHLGHVRDDYESLFSGEKLVGIIDESMAQSSPQCTDCAFMPWCGSDPTYHWSTQRDIVGHKSYSGFCHKNMEIFKHILGILEKGGRDSEILKSWIRC